MLPAFPAVPCCFGCVWCQVSDVVIRVVQSLMAGVVVKYWSTVAKAVARRLQRPHQKCQIIKTKVSSVYNYL